MVHHDREISLSPAMADLIDPDSPQPVEQIDVAHCLGGDPRKDRADRSPRNAHQLRDGRLGRVHRQPRDLVLKRPCEPGVMAGPRDRAHHDTMTPAADPRRVGLNKAEHRAEIQSSPSPASLAQVIARTAAPAHATPIALPPGRAHRHDHLPLNARRYVLDHRSLQPKQPRPYPDTAHVASPPRESSRQEAGNPRRHAACAPSSAPHPTHGNVRSALKMTPSPGVISRASGSLPSRSATMST